MHSVETFRRKKEKKQNHFFLPLSANHILWLFCGINEPILFYLQTNKLSDHKNNYLLFNNFILVVKNMKQENILIPWENFVKFNWFLWIIMVKDTATCIQVDLS